MSNSIASKKVNYFEFILVIVCFQWVSTAINLHKSLQSMHMRHHKAQGTTDTRDRIRTHKHKEPQAQGIEHTHAYAYARTRGTPQSETQ